MLQILEHNTIQHAWAIWLTWPPSALIMSLKNNEIEG